MAVTNLGEDDGGRSATNSKGIRSYTRRWKLETSSKSDDAYAVGSASGLPLIGTAFPSDAGAFCHTLTVENNNPWKGWIVTAEYSSEYELNTNPTLDPAVINWGSEQFQRVAFEDTSGYAILNSFGDYFDPPAMIDDSRETVTITKNLAAVPSWLLEYKDAVNNDSFSIDGFSIGIGKAKMQSVTVAAKEKRNGTTFYPVTFTIHLQFGGWLLELLDAGMRYKTGSVVSIFDNGQPGLLNGSGGKLTNPTPSTAVFRSFTVYKTKAFSGLPLT
jgi:hypothetical protein